jgi:hypothetical protein
MLVGVSQSLKQAGQATRIVALEPSTSPFPRPAWSAPRRGHGGGFWPPPPEQGATTKWLTRTRTRDGNARRKKRIVCRHIDGMNLVAH